MGVYDYITFEGGIEGCPHMRFQTKDLDAQYLDNYYVTPEGRLEYEAYDRYTIPKEERPYPDSPDGSFLSICGMLGRRNIRRESESYTGTIRFYTNGPDRLMSIGLQGQGNQEWDGEKMVPMEEREWFEYEAEFANGVLVGSPVRISE